MGRKSKAKANKNNQQPPKPSQNATQPAPSSESKVTEILPTPESVPIPQIAEKVEVVAIQESPDEPQEIDEPPFQPSPTGKKKKNRNRNKKKNQQNLQDTEEIEAVSEESPQKTPEVTKEGQSQEQKDEKPLIAPSKRSQRNKKKNAERASQEASADENRINDETKDTFEKVNKDNVAVKSDEPQSEIKEKQPAATPVKPNAKQETKTPDKSQKKGQKSQLADQHEGEKKTEVGDINKNTQDKLPEPTINDEVASAEASKVDNLPRIDEVKELAKLICATSKVDVPLVDPITIQINQPLVITAEPCKDKPKEPSTEATLAQLIELVSNTETPLRDVCPIAGKEKMAEFQKPIAETGAALAELVNAVARVDLPLRDIVEPVLEEKGDKGPKGKKGKQPQQKGQEAKKSDTKSNETKKDKKSKDAKEEKDKVEHKEVKEASQEPPKLLVEAQSCVEKTETKDIKSAVVQDIKQVEKVSETPNLKSVAEESKNTETPPVGKKSQESKTDDIIVKTKEEKPQQEPAKPQKEPTIPKQEPATAKQESAKSVVEPEKLLQTASHQQEPVIPKQEHVKPKQEPAKPKQEPANTKQDLAKTQQKPATPKQEPATPKQEPAKPKQKPATPKQEPANTQQEPTTAKQEVAKTQQKSATPKQEPATPKQEPAKPKQELAKPKQETASAQQELAKTQQKPTTPEQEPVTPKQEPAKPKQKSTTPKQETANIQQEPTTPKQEPATPQQEPAKPKQESATPKQETAKIQQEPTTPKQEPATPQQEPAKPKQESATPKHANIQQEPATPKQEPEKPKLEISKSQQETAKTQVELEKPKLEPSKPQQELIKAKQEAVKPKQEPEKPKQESAKPQQESKIQDTPPLEIVADATRKTQNTPPTTKKNKEDANLKEATEKSEAKAKEMPEKNPQEKMDAITFVPDKLIDILDTKMETPANTGAIKKTPKQKESSEMAAQTQISVKPGFEDKPKAAEEAKKQGQQKQEKSGKTSPQKSPKKPQVPPKPEHLTKKLPQAPQKPQEPKESTQAPKKLQLISDDEEEFIEYKFTPRQVFLATICQVCKLALQNPNPCPSCLMVSYCSEAHAKEDAVTHQQLCRALQEIARKRGGHVYNNAKILSNDDFRNLRVHTLNLCESLTQRSLQPFEKEILLFPRICCTATCREWRPPLLVGCQKCGQVSYCKEQPGHLPEDHQRWCPFFLLYQKLIVRQKNTGRIEPSLPSRIFLQRYELPSSMDEVFKELYKNNPAIKDDCTYATLTQLATAPLTAFNAVVKTQLNAQESLTIHLVGAELQFEGDTLDKWEAFFLHLIPQVLELRVVFIGPELNSENLPLDILSRIRMCRTCRQACRGVKFDFQCGKLYHDYAKQPAFTKPDLICFFNPGLYRATGFSGLDTWPDTIKVATSLNCPIVVTSYTEVESPQDLAQLHRDSTRPLNLIHAPAVNPFSSQRPERNFISDEVSPMIFKNYFVFIVS